METVDPILRIAENEVKKTPVSPMREAHHRILRHRGRDRRPFLGAAPTSVPQNPGWIDIRLAELYHIDWVRRV